MIDPVGAEAGRYLVRVLALERESVICTSFLSGREGTPPTRRGRSDA